MPNGKKGFAVLLIVLGALILFTKGIGFGHLLGHLASWLVPLGIFGLGIIGIRSGSRLFGWLFLIVGGFLLLGKLSGLLGLLLAIGLIVYGLSLLMKRSRNISH